MVRTDGVKQERLSVSLRFLICFFQMPAAEETVQSSSSTEGEGRPSPIEWCDFQPQASKMSSKRAVFDMNFTGPGPRVTMAVPGDQQI